MLSPVAESNPDEDLLAILDDLRELALPDDPERAWQRIQLLTQIENRVAAIKLDHIRILHRSDGQDPHGIDTAADRLAGGLHLRPNAAYAQLRTACELPAFPKLEAAGHLGSLSPQATFTIVQVLRRVQRHAPRYLEPVETEMLCAAREMDLEELRQHGSKLLHLLDRHAARQAQDLAHERRRFDLRRRADGWYQCSGDLDPVGGTFLRLALQSIAGKHAPDDSRQPHQVRADALSRLAEHRLTYGDLPLHGQERPHLTIVAATETLRGDDGSPAATIDWGTPVCGETAKRIACDALARIALVGDRGDRVVDVLHLGRAFRTTSVAQRRGLELRDGGCLWPGCGRHPKDAVAHHWRAWASGGATDHENLGLVCPRHHYALHEGGYRAVEVSPQRVVILGPDGSEYGIVARHRWRRIGIRDGSPEAEGNAPPDGKRSLPHGQQRLDAVPDHPESPLLPEEPDG